MSLHSHLRRMTRRPLHPMRLVRLVRLVSAVAALGGLLSAGAVEAQPVSATADGAHRGYLAARLTAGGQLDVIEELHAGQLFVPASVLKLATVAAALEHLGAGYRWNTRLIARGAVDGAALAGDLVVEPGADPTWGPEGGGSAAPAALAEQVRAHGITRIAGDLVVDMSRFPGRRHPLDREYGDLPYAHGTPAAALAVDEGTITVRVAPGTAIGNPARVRAPDGIDIINLTATVGRDRHGSGTLDFVPVWDTDTVVLRGEYPISEPAATVIASDPAPARRAAERLRQALSAAGVTLEGGVRLSLEPAAAGPGEPLAEHRSPPLGDLVAPILTDSHNWYADMLVLALAREVTGSGRFADGVEVVAAFMAGLPGAGSGGRPATWLVDGSGLSPSNLVTPAAIVRLFAYAAGQPWGPTMIDALAGPGKGTLAFWPRLPPVAAKTGTLRHTVALAGILDPGSDAPVIFCYFINQHPEQRTAARREIADALGRWRSPDAAR